MTSSSTSASKANAASTVEPGNAPASSAPTSSEVSPTDEKAKTISKIHFSKDDSIISFNDTSEEIRFKKEPIDEGKIDGEKFDASIIIPKPYEKVYLQKPDTSKSSRLSAFYSKAKYFLQKGYVEANDFVENKETLKALKLRQYLYTNLAYGFLEEKEKKILVEKLKKAWDEYKTEKNLDIKDVISLKMKIPIKKDGKPDFEKEISFQVTIVKRDANGNLLKVEPNCKECGEEIGKYKKFSKYQGRYQTETITLFEKKYYESFDSIKCVATALENWTWEGLEKRKTYKTLEELQKLLKENEPIEKKQKTEEKPKIVQSGINNCWLHEMFQRALRNKAMKTAIEKIEVDNSAIVFDNKNLQNLIKCFQECIDKTPKEQKDIIEKYALQIRKDIKISEKGQEDPNSAYNLLEDFLETQGLIELCVIKQKRVANKLEGETQTDDKFEDTQVFRSIYIRNTSKEKEVNLLKEINTFLQDSIGQIIKKREDGAFKTAPSKQWEITKVETTLPKKSHSIIVEIIDKSTLDVSSFPYGLTYDPSTSKFEFKKDNNDFEFNYATIHRGSKEGGHYFSVYKQEDSWYSYDNLKENPVNKLFPDELKEHLKHATVLAYEKKSKSSES